MNGPAIAVLGTGSIGTRQLEVLKSLGVPSVAVPVRKEKFGILRREGRACASDLKEAKALGARGAVIATDTARHPMDARHALDLGLHVLCEKPLAATAGDARDLPALVRSRGPLFFVACCLRFDEGLQAFKKQLGSIGPVHAAIIECRSYLPDWRPDRDYRQSYSARSSEGGVLLDLIHEIDYALWLFGRPQSVTGILANTGRLDIQTEEVAQGGWKAPKAERVSIGLDYLTRVPLRRISAHGAEGTLHYDFIAGVLRLESPGRPTATEEFPRDRQTPYLHQMESFIDAVGGGEPGDLATLEDGLAALAIVDAWKLSAATGRKEEVPA
ncbi:MAG TPA: oxidoreductase [Syntrophus sp. (in: bacteria)]|nr:oxidoreductase [Syntrophus sp. (in: bacteria)]